MPDRSSILVSMNRLATETRTRIVRCLVEGNSIRSTCRITGAAKNTVLKLLADLGAACDEYQDHAFRGLAVQRCQCDEIWTFSYCKDKQLPKAKAAPADAGSVWTWTALDSDTKLMVTWYVGSRDQTAANRFMLDLASRVDGRFQLTTDGHKPYGWAVALAFEGAELDYAQLIKIYGGSVEDPGTGGRYSPPVCTGTRLDVIRGEPRLEDICTSHVERQNLTMRMGMRRFTRLTNGHSKKVVNLAAAVATHFMFYNYCRPHETLKVGKVNRTPAMAAGVANHVWTLAELIALLPEKTGRFVPIGAGAAAASN